MIHKKEDPFIVAATFSAQQCGSLQHWQPGRFLVGADITLSYIRCPTTSASRARILGLLRYIAVTSLVVGALTSCALPSLKNRTQTVALTSAQAQSTSLAEAVASRTAQHPSLAGIDPLPDPHAAFAARMELARAARRTLDVQYYIWRDDLTGTLLLEELHAAADRGVRVRLLLDDDGIPSSLDATLAALDAHPNIEARPFNPFIIRKPKFIGFLTDFSRANRRMHNKSFTADGTATIVGGRNIGDEYFGATDGSYSPTSMFWQSARPQPMSHKTSTAIGRAPRPIQLTGLFRTSVSASSTNSSVRH